MEQLEEAAESAQKDLDQFDETYPGVATPEEPELDPETGEPVDGGVAAANALQLQGQRRQLADTAAAARSEAKVQKAQIAQRQPYESLGEQSPRLAKRSALEIPTSMPLRASLLGLLGLTLGVILCLILERTNRRIDTRRELADASDLPIIAEVGYVAESRRPEADGAIMLAGVWAESYRRVRSALQFVQAQGAPGAVAAEHATGESVAAAVSATETRGTVFMFTSTAPQEGKTTSAVLTAQALAEVGVRTLLVGADYRRPSLHVMLGAEPGATVSDMTGPVDERPPLDQVVRPTKFPNLYMALSGQPTRDVSDLIAATRQLVAQAAAQRATVIIDTSPLNASSDPLDLLPVVDHVIMVVRSGGSAEADLVESIDTLERLGADVMGTLLVGTPNAGRRQAYYYDYYSAEASPAMGNDQVPFGPPDSPADPDTETDTDTETDPAASRRERRVIKPADGAAEADEPGEGELSDERSPDEVSTSTDT
ncbi:MAG: CpsD/CapB family tyrosine-protein kinase [Candidatus Microthrix sp.]|nr:CpsD/CapB family tyrosine-protein kinase [Candidatus Microthrix sp.]MBK7324193.1 CpsD/CapB family tyrosine-protein kinase [Candidatus Microthrix sp.]